MGAGSALKAREVVGIVRQVLAIELLVAAQALDLRRPLRPGRGVNAAHETVRTRVRHLDADRFLHADLETARALIGDGEVLAAVESVVGALQ
jgi:histidine ammonia-lyase